MKYLSHSILDTTKIASKLADKFQKKGGIITLQGPLGAGKTTFVQAFAKKLGITDKVTSPTFIINRYYNIPNSPRLLHHLDLYRLESSDDIKALSLNELYNNKSNIILIEWPEKLDIQDQKKATFIIKIHPIDQFSREIQIF